MFKTVESGYSAETTTNLEVLMPAGAIAGFASSRTTLNIYTRAASQQKRDANFESCLR